MPYSTPADVRLALSPAGGGGTAGSLDDNALNDAINEADALINTYLEIPEVRTPKVDEAGVALQPVRWWSRNIAAYLATLTYRRGKDLTADDPVRLRYSQTMALLTDIRDGKMRSPIPLTGNPATGSSVEPQVFNQYTGTLFGPEDFGLSTTPKIYDPQHRIWPG